MKLLVNLSWQHLLLEFPSCWDNLNDNVIFVHKVIYPVLDGGSGGGGGEKGY